MTYCGDGLLQLEYEIRNDEKDWEVGLLWIKDFFE
jgi:hypothetical protein